MAVPIVVGAALAAARAVIPAVAGAAARALPAVAGAAARALPTAARVITPGRLVKFAAFRAVTGTVAGTVKGVGAAGIGAARGIANQSLSKAQNTSSMSQNSDRSSYQNPSASKNYSRERSI